MREYRIAKNALSWRRQPWARSGGARARRKRELLAPHHSVALACVPVALALALSDADALPLALALALSDGLSAGDAVPLHEAPGEADAAAVVERLGVPTGEAERVGLGKALMDCVVEVAGVAVALAHWLP